jgi:hypothetical protein
MLGIISWLVNIAKALGYWFQEVFREGVKFATTTWGILLIVGGLAYSAFADSVGAIQSIIDVLSGQSVGTSLASPSGFTYALSIANTFAPMDELFSYGSSYLVLVCGFGLYRLIKSWIPTLTGGG